VKLVGSFVPTFNGNGIDLTHDEVAVTVGHSGVTIPGNLLVPSGAKFTFAGNVDGTDVSLVIKAVAGGFEFRVTLSGLTLVNARNPTFVGLRIGDDLGEATVRLQGVLRLNADDN
jgi:hypothetical protein